MKDLLATEADALAQTKRAEVKTPVNPDVLSQAMQEALDRIADSRAAGTSRQPKSAMAIAAAGGAQEAQFALVKQTLMNVTAQTLDNEFSGKLTQFAADLDVVERINAARPQAIVIPSVNALNVRIVNGFDQEMIEEYVKTAGAVKTGLVITEVGASDIETVKASLAKQGIEATVTSETAEEYLRAQNLLEANVVTQIRGAETLDAKRYAQVLAGAAQLGVVVIGVEKKIAGVTQTLFVSEILSAAYGAARSIATAA